MFWELRQGSKMWDSWLVVVKSAINAQIFATYENQPHNNTLGWFPHHYLVNGCCNGESDFSPVLIILNSFNPFASTFDTDVIFLF